MPLPLLLSLEACFPCTIAYVIWIMAANIIVGPRVILFVHLILVPCLSLFYLAHSKAQFLFVWFVICFDFITTVVDGFCR